MSPKQITTLCNIPSQAHYIAKPPNRIQTLTFAFPPLPPSASPLSAKHGMFTVVVIWIPVLTANPMSDVTSDSPTKLKKHQQSPGARPERATNPDSDSGKGRQTLHPGRPNCTGEHFCFGNRCQCLGHHTIICAFIRNLNLNSKSWPELRCLPSS